VFRYRIRNWREYNRTLVNRGRFTVHLNNIVEQDHRAVQWLTRPIRPQPHDFLGSLSLNLLLRVSSRVR